MIHYQNEKKSDLVLAFGRDPNLPRLLLPWINDKEPFYRKIFGDMERRVYKKAILERR